LLLTLLALQAISESGERGEAEAGGVLAGGDVTSATGDGSAAVALQTMTSGRRDI